MNFYSLVINTTFKSRVISATFKSALISFAQLGQPCILIGQRRSHVLHLDSKDRVFFDFTPPFAPGKSSWPIKMLRKNQRYEGKNYGVHGFTCTDSTGYQFMCRAAHHSGVRGPSWLTAQLFAHTRRNWITSPQRAICSFTEFFMPLSFSIDLGWKEFSVTPDWCSQEIWHHWAFSQSPRIISRIVTFEIWQKIPWVSRRTLELDILNKFLKFIVV